MTTGIGNEWDPGDPPEIHKERKREKPAAEKPAAASEPASRGAQAEFDARAWLINDFKLMGTPDEDEIEIAQRAYAAGLAAPLQPQVEELRKLSEAATTENRIPGVYTGKANQAFKSACVEFVRKLLQPGTSASGKEGEK